MTRSGIPPRTTRVGLRFWISITTSITKGSDRVTQSHPWSWAFQKKPGVSRTPAARRLAIYPMMLKV